MIDSGEALRDQEKAKQPVTQKQEDLLLELFFQLSVKDRKKAIRYLRDLIQESSTYEEGRATQENP